MRNDLSTEKRLCSGERQGVSHLSLQTERCDIDSHIANSDGTESCIDLRDATRKKYHARARNAVIVEQRHAIGDEYTVPLFSVYVR